MVFPRIILVDRKVHAQMISTLLARPRFYVFRSQQPSAHYFHAQRQLQCSMVLDFGG